MDRISRASSIHSHIKHSLGDGKDAKIKPIIKRLIKEDQKCNPRKKTNPNFRRILFVTFMNIKGKVC